MAKLPTNSEGLMCARADVLFEDVYSFAKRSQAELVCCFFVRDNALQMSRVDVKSLSTEQRSLLVKALRESADDLEKT